AFDRSSEGDMLAPLVTLLRGRLDAIPEPQKLDQAALDAEKITAALRSAIAAASPLTALPSKPPMPAKTNADLVNVLRRVYGVDPPKGGEVADARELTAEALKHYEGGSGGTELPSRAQAYASSIKDKSAATVTRILMDLEQPLQEEAGAEAAILKLIE